MERIGIIVPLYNAQEFLRRCLDSVLDQTYSYYEVMLVDDGSTDSSGQICDEYVLKNSNFHVIHQDNGGLCVARNVGLKWARSREDINWITFIDSDDRISENYLYELYSSARKHNVDISISSIYTGMLPEYMKMLDDDKNDETIDCESFWVNYHIPMVVWGKLYKKELFDNIVFPAGKPYDDQHITFRVVFKVGKVSIARNAHYYYYQNINGLSHMKKTPEKLRDSFDAYDEQLDFFRGNYQQAYRITILKYTIMLRYTINTPDMDEAIILYSRKKLRHFIWNDRHNLSTSDYLRAIEYSNPILKNTYSFFKRRFKFWNKKTKGEIRILKFDDTKWLCPCILKSGFSSLGYVYYYKKTGRLLEKTESVYNNLKTIWKNDYRRSDCENYQVFVVWRDPVKRFVSMYTEMMTNPDSHINTIKNIRKVLQINITREDFLSDISVFVDVALKVAEFQADRHVDRLCDLLKMAKIKEKDIDTLVPIDELQAFIENELKFDLTDVHCNKSSSKIDVSGFEPYYDRIREFYKCDYEFYERHQAIIYDAPGEQWQK